MKKRTWNDKKDFSFYCQPLDEEKKKVKKKMYDEFCEVIKAIFYKLLYYVDEKTSWAAFLIRSYLDAWHLQYV